MNDYRRGIDDLRAENEQLRDDLVEAQRSANVWKELSERWDRDHTNIVLPYTSQLEDERNELQARIDAALKWTNHLAWPHISAPRLLKRIHADLTEKVDMGAEES